MALLSIGGDAAALGSVVDFRAGLLLALVVAYALGLGAFNLSYHGFHLNYLNGSMSDTASFHSASQRIRPASRLPHFTTFP